MRGHTKNACDRMFMLLKQNFHKQNIYTKKQLHDNFNHNVGVEAIRCDENTFYDLDSLLDKFYKRPASGTVAKTHLFHMFHDRPCIIELQHSPNSTVSTQDLRKGHWSAEDRVRQLKEELQGMMPMHPPGLRPIKILELAKKWRPLVPEEFQDDLCPLPNAGVMRSVAEEVSNAGINEGEVEMHTNGEEETSQTGHEMNKMTETGAQMSANDNLPPSQQVDPIGTANVQPPPNEDVSNMSTAAPQRVDKGRVRRRYRCRICKQYGHNSRKCPEATQTSN